MADKEIIGKSEARDDEQPIFTLIQAIKDGRTDPGTLTKEMRQDCVEVFLCEGYSISNIAQVLKKCERTIKRDIQEIRERHSLTPDIDLVKRIVGEFLWQTRNHISHLMRLARGKVGSVGEKAQAEYYAFQIMKDFITKLQSVGYIPSVPQAVVGEVFHHHTSDDDSDNIKAQIIELEKIIDIEGIQIPDIKEQLDELKNKVQLQELRTQIEDNKKKGGSNERGC